MIKTNTKSFLEKIKNGLLISIIYILKTQKKGLIWIFQVSYKILPKLLWPAKKVFKPLILKLYHVFFKLRIQKSKTEQIELFKPTNKNHIEIFSYIILSILGIFVFTNNLFGKIPEPDELSKRSLISKIIPSENDYYSTSQETFIDQSNPHISKFYINKENGSLESPMPQATINTSNVISNFPQTTDMNSSLVGIQLSESALKRMPRDKIIDYQVEAGDVISTIAQKFSISVQTILWSNDLTYYSLIKPGITLKILPTTGLLHKVQRGDNLSAIAKKYQADADKILSYNKLASAEEIAIDQDLIIPDGIKPATAKSTVTYNRPSQSGNSNTVPAKASVINTGTKLLWPTAAKRISQYFSWRHSGLDIAGPVGTAIYAAESGTVETAGWNKGGYGYYIIINHGNGMRTLYGHASKLYVSAGQKVTRGQTIMAMGSTGRSTGPHLHFEVRIGGFKNPLSYIR